VVEHESAVKIQATMRGKSEREALMQAGRQAWRNFRAEAAEAAADPMARAAAEAIFQGWCAEAGGGEGVAQDAMGSVMAAISGELYGVTLSPATLQLAATIVGGSRKPGPVDWAEFYQLYATVLKSPLLAAAHIKGRAKSDQ
jgi:hypothetical protein